MSLINKQIVLAQRPVGEPKLTDFKVIEETVPDIQDGEVLLKTKYFSLDPYMRRLLSMASTYAAAFELGKAIIGSAVCVVVESKNPKYKAGEHVLSFSGWQTYFVTKEDLIKLPEDIKPSYFLGALGMPGFTAHYGLNEIGEPKSGETVVVSAATGAVGSMVGQFAKLKGCRVVGIAGGPEKCRHAVQELGFDACVDHKSASFEEDLKAACPQGIDVNFENVGGKVFFTVFPLLNNYARVPFCGAISWYNHPEMIHEADLVPRMLLAIVGKRLKLQGFIILDHNDLMEAFLKETVPLIKSGKIKVKEDIVKGIEKAPGAFIGLLKGENFGKLLIEV